MEYQKIANFLKNTPNQPFKFRTKNGNVINNDARGTYNTNSQIKSKITKFKSGLCNYNDGYIFVKGIIKVKNTGTAANPNDNDKKVILKNDFAK